MSFLRHDMSSVDPNITYEPSKGDPSRVRRRIHGKATTDGQYIFVDGSTTEKIPENTKRHKYEEKVKTAHLGSSSFYSGDHSYLLKKETPGSFQSMFTDPQSYKQEFRRKREVNQEYVRANERRAMEKQKLREEQKKIDEQARSSRLSSDPWSRTTYKEIAPGARLPRKKYDYEDLFADKSSYAAKNFGKSNMKKDKAGNVVTKRTNEVASLKVFNKEGEDSYVARAFGKEGFGAPQRTPSGQIQTRRSGKLQSYAIHNESDGNTYADKAFGKGGPKRTGSGRIDAHHSNILTNSRHHRDTPGPAYNDQVFEKSPPKTDGRRIAFEHRMQKEQEVKHDFLDNFPKKKANARPHRLSRDPEFSQKGRKDLTSVFEK